MNRSSLPPNVAEALRRGNKIEAIKLLREAMGGGGLAEAKAFLDRLQEASSAATAAPPASRPRNKPAARAARLAAPPSRRNGLSPGEEPRGNENPMVVVGVIVLAALALWLYSNY